MRFRKLRIAWSVACGIAAVLLIALWVRSYRQRDRYCCIRFMPMSSPLSPFEGGLFLTHLTPPAPLPIRWEYNIDPIRPSDWETWDWQVSALYLGAKGRAQ